jgi:hypothetical protein
MYTPKKDIYKLLNTLPYDVAQNDQNVFNELPAITFYVIDNTVNLDLNNEITYQNIIVNIDIWTSDSTTGSKILTEVEKLMRSNYYRLQFSGDVPNTDKSVFHINSKFIKQVGG